MEQKRFSVLMSLYIGEKAEFFDCCMRSLLRQTVLPNEIVIVLDGPIREEVQEKLNEFCSQYPELIRVIKNQKNKGLGLALAQGVPACAFDLIARMDTDDIAREDRFEKQLRVFSEDEELDICGSYIAEFEDTPDHILSYRKVPIDDGDIKKYQRQRSAFNHMTVMYKKQSVLRAGNYQHAPLMEDDLLWVNMIQAGAKCKNVPECLVYARTGPSMIARRGGWSYFLKYIAGRKRILKTGYISFWDYLKTVVVQFVVALIPGKMRAWFFVRFLRKE